MTVSNYCIETLNKDHDKKVFSCGREPLDRYLAHQASQDKRRRVAVTYVLIDNEKRNVAGYYTLSATNIKLHSLPKEIVRKLPRYPTLPATLLGRLAVDQNYQGRQLGELLLIDALKRSFVLSSQIASAVVIVDPKDDEATQFYQHYAFIPFIERTKQLFLPMRTVEKIKLSSKPVALEC